MAFGGAVKLKGESEYRKALNNIKLGLKEVTAQMKLTSVSYDKNDKSVAALTAQTKDLSTKMGLQKEKVEQIKKEYANLSQQYDKQTQKHNTLLKSYENEKAKLEQVEQELGTTSKEYEEQKKVVEQYEADIKKSSKAQESNQETLSKMRVELKNAEADYKTSEKAIENVNKELENSKKKASEAQSAYGKLKGEIADQESQLKTLKDKYASVILEQGKNSKEAQDLKTSYQKLADELKDNKTKLNDVEQELKDVGEAAQDSGDKAESAANGGFTVFKGTLSNMISGVLSDAVSKLKDIAKEAINAGMNFESAMSQVEAVSGATGDDLTKLTSKAEEMGAKTKFSATQSAEAFNYMAMAGWKTTDMIDGIEGVMNLAAASGEDLATTSDIVTDALTAMGYSAKDSGRLADVMAAASANANTNVSLMGSTFQYAAPIVGALGYSMEDTAVAIGLMANAGIKGDKAGTALRSTLTRLSAPPKDCAEAMDKLGLSIKNSDDTMKPLRTVIDDLRKKFKGLSASEQTATAKHIAGAEAMSGLLAIVNAAPADYKKLIKAVDESKGSAKKMADTMNNNVAGSMTLLKSQIEGVQIQLFKKLAPAFQTAIKEAGKFISGVDWNKFGNTVKGALDKAMQGLKWIIDNHQIVVGGMQLIVGAFAVKKIWDWTKGVSDAAKSIVGFVTQTISSTTATSANTAAEVANTGAKAAGTTATGALTTAQKLLNGAMSANPVGLVIAGLTTLVSVIATVTSSTDTLTEKEKEQQEALQNQTDEINNAVKSYKDLEKQKQKAIDKGMTEIDNYGNLWDELQSIIDQNGKVKKGYEERASFITSTLSEALGIEIKTVDGVVQKYKDVADQIDKVMEKKKAQIILDSQKDLYAEALTNQQNAIKELNTLTDAKSKKQAEVKKLEKEYSEESDARAKTTDERTRWYHTQRMQEITKKIEARNKELENISGNYDKQEELVRKYAYNIGVYEKNLELSHKGEYDKMTTVTWEYVKDYQKAGEAEKKTLEAQIKTTETNLKILKDLKKKSGTDIYDEQIKVAEKQLKQQKADLKKYNEATDKGLKNDKVVWSKNLDANLSAVTGKKIKFKDAGSGNVQMYVDGVKTGEPKSKKEMASLVNKAIKEITNKKKDGKKAGEDLIDGVNNGVKNQNKQSSVFRSIANFGSNLLASLRNALKEKSPSKATKEMGEFLMQGLSIGVEKESRNALKTVRKTGANVLTALNAELTNAGAKMGNISVTPFIPNLTATVRQNTPETPKQDNVESSMVDAFKTALGQMKIELDDEAAGKFVERTVTRIIYT